MNLSGSAQQAIGSLTHWGSRPKWVEQAVTVTLPKTATLLLLLFVGYQAATMTWQFVGEPDISQQPKGAQKPVTQATQPKTAQHGSRIAMMHLFGVEGQRTTKNVVKKAPETRLKLTLHGVFVGKGPEKGSAIIGQANGKQRFYKTGTSISGGVTLKEVYADHVVLMRSGRSEVLRFPKTVSKGLSVKNRTVATTTRSNKESLKSYRDTFAKQPLKIFQHLRFIPVKSQEGVKGYRILPQGNRELFNKLGVKSSDLVTAINGTPLTDERKALQLLSELKNTKRLELDIVRKGVTSSLSLNLD